MFPICTLVPEEYCRVKLKVTSTSCDEYPHFEVRRQGYYAVQPTMVPHEIVTKDDVESALHAIGSLGSAIDRISSSLKSSLHCSIGDIVPTERGQDILSKRDGGK